MVCTELSYNPYLRETVVKFNGESPRINSQIEKFQDKNLQDWIDKLPVIFHDEMNGYGFDLHFSGVKEDFERIKTAFAKVGVSEKEVTFFFKTELENPYAKNKHIAELLKWLEDNPNRRFDFDLFKADHKELLDIPYSFITVNGRSFPPVTLAGESVTVENIENVDELSSTDLTYTPIIVFVDSRSNEETRNMLRSVICCDNIAHNQLFFCIDPAVNTAKIKRIINDLGIIEPNFVSGVNDPKIAEYFEVYPLTDFIKTFLYILRKETEKMQSVLDVENEKCRIVNSEVHAEIDILDKEIAALKNADTLFLQRANIINFEEYTPYIDNFAQKIAEWRKKKTNTTSWDEAVKMADEFDSYLKKLYSDFVSQIDNAFVRKSEEIDKLFIGWFADTEVDTDYVGEIDFGYPANDYIPPDLKEQFRELKTEQYVDSNKKGSFLDFFIGGSNGGGEKILETTFTYETWRTLAFQKYEPFCRQIIDDWAVTLTKYYSMLANVYHKHISELIRSRTEHKNVISQQLSEDEKLLQIDNDWLVTLKDKLHLIERG